MITIPGSGTASPVSKSRDLLDSDRTTFYKKSNFCL